MNQSSITTIVKALFEKHFFSVADWLSEVLHMPQAFTRYPVYPGISVVVNGQRVLEFKFLSRPLTADEGNYALVNTTGEAACFDPYNSNKGPMVTIDEKVLASEAMLADIPEEALLEVLVLHEMVHACMMGYIAQNYPAHPWVIDRQFRYIHEAVAMKVSEFGIGGFLEVATPQHLAKYLSYIQSVSSDRGGGAYYKPYFETYRMVALENFWSELRCSQPSPGIFEMVEGLD